MLVSQGAWCKDVTSRRKKNMTMSKDLFGLQKMYVLKTIMLRLLAVFAVIGSGHNAYSAPQILSHAAIYDVRLSAAIGPNAPSGLSGSMIYAVRDTCDGFQQDSTLDVTIRSREGGQSPLRQSFASFESKDQNSSTFRVRVSSAGREVDDYSGEIDLQGRDRAMTYNRPEGDERVSHYDLKRGAVLSLAFTDEVIELAKAGKPFISRVVADGLLENGPHRISAVIGRRLDQVSDVSDPDDLLSAPAWPIQLAYYPEDDPSELPSEEMRVEIYEGGIVGKISQDMGDYTVVTSLVDVQAVEGCNP